MMENSAAASEENSESVSGPAQLSLPLATIPQNNNSEAGPAANGALCVRYSSRDGTPCNELQIIGWPSTQDQALLEQRFGSAGFRIVNSKLVPDSTGCGTCEAFVRLNSAEEAGAAIQALNGTAVETDMHAPRIVPTSTALRPPMMQNQGAMMQSQGAPIMQSQGAPMMQSQGAPMMQNQSGPMMQSQMFGKTNHAMMPRNEFIMKHVKLTIKYSSRDQTPCSELYIVGWPSSSDMTQLSQTFKSLGYRVENVKLLPDVKGGGTCCGFVQLASIEEAANAISSLNGVFLDIPCNNPQPYGGGFGNMAGNGAKGCGYGGMFGNGGLGPQSYGQGFGAGKGPQPYGGAGNDMQNNGFMSQPCGFGNSMGTNSPMNQQYGGMMQDAMTNNPLYANLNMSWKLTMRFSTRDQSPNDEVYFVGWPTCLDAMVLGRMFEARGFIIQKWRLLPDTKQCGMHAGFVLLKSAEEATLAIQSFNQQPLGAILPDMMITSFGDRTGNDGGATSMLPSSAPSNRPASVTLSVKYSARDGTPSNEVFFMGWPSCLSTTELNHILIGLGYQVSMSRLLPDTKGFGLCGGFIQFGSVDQAAMCIESMNGVPFYLPAPYEEFVPEAAPEVVPEVVPENVPEGTAEETEEAASKRQKVS